MEYLYLASFGEIMSSVLSVLLAVLVLLVMITVHELGHYITGKIMGFGIEEFAIGFGPKLFKKTKKNGEVFSIRALPLGGFCAFKGEDDDSDDPTAFNNKKPWQRIIVLVSGALMNYLFALLVIMITFFSYGQAALVTYVVDDNPAYYEYSFNKGDVILEANGKSVYLVTDLMTALENKEAGELVEFTILRGGEKKDVLVMLRDNTHFSSVEDMTRLYRALGVHYEIDSDSGAMINGGLYQKSIRFGFFDTIGRSFEYSFKLASSIFIVLKQLITGALGISSLGGTVTTIAITADAIKLGGLRHLLNMTSLIGVNLAVFNLLPIPALDGSRVVFTAIEWIRGKPISRRVEGIIHAAGLMFLVLFAVVIDLQRCF